MTCGERGSTIDEQLAFDISFALPRGPVRGLRRAFTEDVRAAIARRIIKHLKLCNWRFEPGTPLQSHGAGKGTKGPAQA